MGGQWLRRRNPLPPRPQGLRIAPVIRLTSRGGGHSYSSPSPSPRKGDDLGKGLKGLQQANWPHRSSAISQVFHVLIVEEGLHQKWMEASQ